MSKVPLTVVGAELLRAELQHLKNVERPNVIAAIAEAREQIAAIKAQTHTGWANITWATTPSSKKLIFLAELVRSTNWSQTTK